MIDVYAVLLEDRLEDDLFQTLLNSVEPEKREKIKKFRRWEDGHRTLYADLLIRSILMNRPGVDNEEISFSTNPCGKPFLRHSENVYFNCGHSGRWIVCGVGHCPVGVDVEKIKKDNFDISERFFSAEEHQTLLRKNKSERLDIFFTLWTLKESYLKAVGKGLYQSLNSFTIQFLENKKIVLSLDGRLLPMFFFECIPSMRIIRWLCVLLPINFQIP